MSEGRFQALRIEPGVTTVADLRKQLAEFPDTAILYPPEPIGSRVFRTVKPLPDTQRPC